MRDTIGVAAQITNYLRYMTRKTRIVVRNDVDLPQGGYGSSTRADTNFLLIQVENGGNQKANFMRNNVRIEKDIARILRLFIVGLDSLSL